MHNIYAPNVKTNHMRIQGKAINFTSCDYPP